MVQQARQLTASHPRSEFFLSSLQPIVKEGLLEGTSISLFGAPGAGKTILCQSLTKSFLENDIHCLYITTDRSPSDIRRDFQMLGIDISYFEKKRKFAFVDGYSWLAGNSTESFSAQNLANLSELMITIDKALSYFEDRVFLVLDSVSPLPLYNPELDVTKFMQLLISRIKTRESLAIFAVQSGVHSLEFCNALAYLADGVFDLKVEEGNMGIKRYFRVRNLRYTVHDTRWTPLVISSRIIKLQYKEAS